MKTILALALLLIAWSAPGKPLRVCATTPDLGDLVQQIGGDQVLVVVFAKGTEDPHHLQARPSFIRELAAADLFVLVGLDLESGWAPVLLQGCRNGAVQPGRPGYLDASTAITPLHDHAGATDRSAGHVHPNGNPHYLLDPAKGIVVAKAICDRLCQLRPAERERFTANYQTWRRQMAIAMMGEKLADKHDPERLANLLAEGKLATFLEARGELDQLGGWFGAMLPFAGTPVVVDHAMWIYFSDRFRLRQVAALEPKPGIAPSTRHLQEVIDTVKRLDVPAILTAAYFPPKHAAFVAKQSGAVTVPMCHQVGATEQANTYLRMIDVNVRAFVEAVAR